MSPIYFSILFTLSGLMLLGLHPSLAEPQPQPTPSSTASAVAVQAPVSISSCQVRHTPSFVRLNFVPMNISFINNQNKEVTNITIEVTDSGIDKGEITYPGNFAPGVTINIRYPFKGTIDDPASVGCEISYIRFSDGSEWHPTTGVREIIEQPDSPIHIDSCNVSFVAADSEVNSRTTTPTQNYNLVATVSFTNRSLVTATAVKFTFNMYDAFNGPLYTGEGTVLGHFATGTQINPSEDAMTGRYLANPGSPVWYFYNLSAYEVAESQCRVENVRMADGTVWSALQIPESKSTSPPPPK